MYGHECIFGLCFFLSCLDSTQTLQAPFVLVTDEKTHLHQVIKAPSASPVAQQQHKVRTDDCSCALVHSLPTNISAFSSS